MIHTSFNGLDIAFFGLVALSCLVGVVRGVTREVLGIVGWIGAVMATLYSIPLFHPVVQQYITNPTISRIVTGIVVFIVALSILIVVSKMIAQHVKSSALGGIDRSLGLLFGIGRGIVLGCVIYIVMTLFWTPKDLPELVQTARSTPWVKDWSEGMKALLPPSYQSYFKEHHAKEALNIVEDIHRLHHRTLDMEKTVENLSTLHAAIKKDAIKEKMKDAEKEFEEAELENTLAPQKKIHDRENKPEETAPDKRLPQHDFLDELMDDVGGGSDAQ